MHFGRSSAAFLFNSETTRTTTSSTTTSATEDDANSYLVSLGYTDTKVQDGMKDALKSVFGKHITAANIKSIGAEGEREESE